MSTPLALIQQAYAAFGRGDVPAMLALMSPEVEFRFVGDRLAPYTGTVKGTAQVAEWLATVVQADDIQVFEPRRMLAGEDHVTVIGWERTFARATGKAFECDWIHVWTVRDGRIAAMFGMLDTQAAGTARA